ncbi:MAG TPA: hypothetical protein PLU66_10205 [Trueperaceae bacterium]|nr:hypothetical protein [Trueperaceae bacterium]
MPGSGSYPGGQAMVSSTPARAAAFTCELATLLPSPTNVSLRPASCPNVSLRVT